VLKLQPVTSFEVWLCTQIIVPALSAIMIVKALSSRLLGIKFSALSKMTHHLKTAGEE
jgi:hypothetical protein